ncbi:MAG: hypothetical protein C0463_03455 [Idiomarina sp.]|nr:hypothetical protein [Idiomarina sp.]
MLTPMLTNRTSWLRTFTVAFTVLVLNACVSAQPPVDQSRFSEPYTRSVLILPPANQTTAAQASELYYTSLAVPLTRAGFYVFPSLLTQRIMQNEGIIDGAQLDNVDLALFRQMFGTDMVLRTRVTRWDTSYVVITGSVTVSVEYELVSTHSGNILWEYSGSITENTGSQNTSLLGALLETALNTAQQDYIPIARELNRTAFARVPIGPYHPRYLTEEEFAARLAAWREENQR